RIVLLGSVLTAVLFMIGKYALSIYFGKAEPASVYGAGGSVILILLWTSYSSMIVFFGAEFTRQYALYHKVDIVPKPNAVVIDNAVEALDDKKENAKAQKKAEHASLKESREGFKSAQQPIKLKSIKQLQ